MLAAFTFLEGHLHPLDNAGDDAALRSAVWVDLAEPTEDEIARVQRVTGLRRPDASQHQ